MHEQIVKIVLLRSFVLLGSEPCQAFLKYENPQRVNPIHQNVDSQVKFESVNQVRFRHVSLCDEVLTLLLFDIFEAPDQVDASPLAHVDWLDDVGLVLFLIKLCFQVCVVGWQLPGFWEKVVRASEFLLHPH